MANELSIIQSTELTDVSEKEINDLIEKIVEDSKENFEELSELTLECTTLLASAESRSTALSEQGAIERVVGNITGKNDRLRNAILKDNTNALYTAQQMINCVMAESANNKKLFSVVNDRISDVYLDLKNTQNDLAENDSKIRKAIVAFYKQYKEELLVNEERLTTVENSLKGKCENCNKEIPISEVVCPYCGNIHSLKIEKLSPKVRSRLEELSKVVKDENAYEDIFWSEIAKKKARVLRKAKLMGELGIIRFTEEIDQDIDSLINKCRNEEFQIAIVGVVKSGKSFLMNALMGKELASVDVTPETAALTKFRASNKYYIKVQFYNEEEWEEFKKSVEQSNGKMKKQMEETDIHELEKELINHDEVYHECENIEELRYKIKEYTSAEAKGHLFVSEVEVGVDASVFKMPKEVVFVDTPGLHDPVKYRADITKKYIKKADALLIAVKVDSQSEEAYKVITSALDCIDKKRAFIIATKKDTLSKEDCNKSISSWVNYLVEGGFYTDDEDAWNSIIQTSARMDMLVNKCDEILSFSTADRIDFESYVKKLLDDCDYVIRNIDCDSNSIDRIKQDAGIDKLRIILSKRLIDKHKELKEAEIVKKYNECKSQIEKICNIAVDDAQEKINLAESNVEVLKLKYEEAQIEERKVKQANNEIRTAADQLEKEIKNMILNLERKIIWDQ